MTRTGADVERDFFKLSFPAGSIFSRAVAIGVATAHRKRAALLQEAAELDRPPTGVVSWALAYAARTEDNLADDIECPRRYG